MKIALASYCDKVRENTRHDDKILKLALERLGNEVEVIDWQAKSIMDLHSYQAIVINTTWNLHKHPKEFDQWLRNCESDGKKRLINDQEILRLGIRKDHYFVSLIEEFGSVDSPKGSIIPSVFITKEDVEYRNKSFMEILSILIQENQQIWSEDIVIKPITSAGGENTYRFTDNIELLKKDCEKHQSFIDANKFFLRILRVDNNNGAIIQPFINAVETSGEYQLIFIDSKYSHAIIKSKGFRNTNSSLKRYINKNDLPEGMLNFAERIINFFASHYAESIVTRARIDLFYGKKGPILCEVELIEPNINIECLPKYLGIGVTKKYAKAIIKQANFFSREYL